MVAVSLLALPNEVLFLVFDHLSARDLVSLSQVSSRLRYLTSDQLLWQCKLTRSLCYDWDAISFCQLDRRDLLGRVMDQHLDLEQQHPRNLYLSLLKFTSQNAPPPPPPVEEDSPPTGGFTSFLGSIVQTLGTFIPPLAWDQQQQQQATKARFAIFGSGFDSAPTNRLFNRMLDNRTKSFLPMGMFMGVNGLGNGLTMKMTHEAQQAVLEEQFESPLQQPASLSSSEVKLLRFFGAPVPDAASSPHDYLFDLVHLFASDVHLNTQYKDQLTRITESCLFVPRALTSPGSDAETALKQLEPVFHLRQLLQTIHAFIYAIDATNDYASLQLLRHELDAVNSCIVRKTAWPILFLYIMPKEIIKKTARSQNELRRLNRESKSDRPIVAMNNGKNGRDSFSGSIFTKAWRGSLLEPISAMRLFELENPWRLQKCASSDVKSLVQGIMWLRDQMNSSSHSHSAYTEPM